MTESDARGLYRKLAQCAYYKYNEKMVFVSHGGVSRIPSCRTLIDTETLIKGVGRYPDAEEVERVFDSSTGENFYQIHGHRNITEAPIHSSTRNYNLEGGVEMGGCLRIVELSKEGFNEISIQNPVPPKGGLKSRVVTPITNVKGLVASLRGDEGIGEKVFGDISSFNFSRSVFTSGRWTDITCRARGLYINTITEEIVARSYNKFFNLGERPETSMDSLKENLKFPVTACVKENGFLGIVGYDSWTDSMIVTSKSSLDGEYARMFQEILFNSVSEEKVKSYLKSCKYSLVFEVIDIERDPHIIEYEKSKVVLLDIIYNTVEFKKRTYEDVVSLALMLGIECKEQGEKIHDFSELMSWYDKVMERDYEYRGKKIEGFVIEDTSGFMTKIKLNYYSRWKYLRGVSISLLKRGSIAKEKWEKLSAEDSEFCSWLLHEVYPLKNERGEYSFKTDIITLRKNYEKYG